ncbi:DUF2797 domain-containing protein [Actinacidiphila alni]|uniref:DUF2797 domain-containing protein n=1 Tax=Actinacidiphila alni TaxID=380248 RepID=UPI000B892DD7|nr:DUF2797 domain-containing protein [Actinacidiphila alni]
MWRCTGLGWSDGRPGWTWWHPVRGGRSSPLRLGGPVSLAVAADAVRTCAGVWRGGRYAACPYGAVLPPEARRDQCERCAALDRSYSVAADTKADDPRPYAVYLAWFGPGLLKVGITAAERGAARLLEQAAVCFTFLGEGPLMTARRTEAILGAALGVPDRVASQAKRAARHALPDAGARAAELRALHASVTDQLPDTLRPRPCEIVDHAGLFGLAPTQLPPPVGQVSALPPGSALTGTLVAAAGPDLYVRTAEPDGPGRLLLLDTRLARGWPLHRPPEDAPQQVPTVDLVPPKQPRDAPQPLF